jgi:hypothetical protein
MPDELDEYDECDMDAFRRALSIAMTHDKPTRVLLESKLREDTWLEAAKHASYHCQVKALKLELNRSPPSYANEDDPASIVLHDRLLAAGLSKWEPDPEWALGEIEGKTEGE